jgi:integrase
MGCVYDRNKSRPEKGPNIWIKYKDPAGRWRCAPVGHVNPEGLAKAKVEAKAKKLRRLAKDILTKIEGDIVAGRYELADETRDSAARRLFKAVAEAWVKRRKEANTKDPMVHRAWRDDQCRVNGHLVPYFGSMMLGEIDTGRVKGFIGAKRGKLARQTIVNCLNLLSRMFNDLREEGEDLVNPVVMLDRPTRRAIGPRQDPRKTPFLRTRASIRAVHLALVPPVQVMFDVGVFAGLRTGEIQALEAGDVDLGRRRIRVVRSVDGPLKNNHMREVPILDALVGPLRQWLVGHPGEGVLFPPTRRRGRYMRKHTLYRHLREALAACELPVEMTWYQCTRHTFASHWVMDGRPIEKLRQVLGHSTVTVTERYAHLSPEMFSVEDLAALAVDLGEGQVVPIRAQKEVDSA